MIHNVSIKASFSEKKGDIIFHQRIMYLSDAQIFSFHLYESSIFENTAIIAITVIMHISSYEIHFLFLLLLYTNYHLLLLYKFTVILLAYFMYSLIINLFMQITFFVCMVSKGCN